MHAVKENSNLLSKEFLRRYFHRKHFCSHFEAETASRNIKTIAQRDDTCIRFYDLSIYFIFRLLDIQFLLL